jgi:hypothetical protein
MDKSGNWATPGINQFAGYHIDELSPPALKTTQMNPGRLGGIAYRTRYSPGLMVAPGNTNWSAPDRR